MYLVSVEGRYTTSAKGFDFDSMTGNTIRLVMLYNWKFTCAADTETFTGLLDNLNTDYSDNLLFRYPPTSSDTMTDTEPFLSQGLVPLKFHQMDGSSTYAWYRSPFVPGSNSQTIELPVLSSKTLIQAAATGSSIQWQDLSYAAAWELGRYLTLQSSKVSVALYNWKCQQRQQQKLAQQEKTLLHLPLTKSTTNANDNNDQQDTNTKTVTKWFDQLSLLQGVPFNYLVPNENMLPVESIRFFQVDPLWVDCLLDGALSIGRVTDSDKHSDGQLGGITDSTLDTLTGMLLRSDLVSGWPHLQVDGKTSDKKTVCTLLRMDRLSSNVLLCLFLGQPATIDIYQRSEGLFFGVTDDNGSYSKIVRNKDGSETKENDGVTPVSVSISWKNNDDTYRVIDLNALATTLFSKSDNPSELSSTTPAYFAMQMIEGVGKGTYSISSET